MSTDLSSAAPLTVRMGLIEKHADWTFERFSDHWRAWHGPLAAQVPGLRGYWQNVVTDREQRGIAFARGPWNFDGFSQLWFDDKARADAGFTQGELAQRLIADENHFIGKLHIITTAQHTVIAVPPLARRARLLKRISILKRQPGLSEADFRREWVVHGEHVKKMPGVQGYRQNVVTDRERTKGMPCPYADLPIDGIVEFWFTSTTSLDAAFASPAGQITMRHAGTFLSEITTFLVEERRVV